MQKIQHKPIDQQQTKKRKRGVILSNQGLNRLQAAKLEIEEQENSGNRYTLEMMSFRTGLAVDTIMKIFAPAKVDKRTIKLCFKAFNLILEPTDYTYPETEETTEIENTQIPELPGGQVPIGSTFYIERFPIESRSDHAISQPGALIRICAPKQMGKTSLMARILANAKKHGARTVALSFQLADEDTFTCLDNFLKWFCGSVSKELNLSPQLASQWSDSIGSKCSATDYFKNHILTEIDSPLVIALDEVNCIFQNPEVASEFFALLRAWYEKAKYNNSGSDIWQKLRLVIVHSTEFDIPETLSKFMFNVGLCLDLPEFNQQQVENLAKRYGVIISSQQLQKLISFVGGHPYRVQLALYHLWHQDITLEQLLQNPAEANKIYSVHLQQHLWNLQQDPELAAAFTQVLQTSAPIELEPRLGLKLQGLGLVNLQANVAKPSCELYRQYFSPA
ncbi:MAG: AAA-like domain-containing protein [Microcoleaceae cyanobacterium MO_207.B10]|nr:AAA-like domain-containing protein [Microcoleaceae cyanobacterium MO_207.B10]